MRWAILGAVTFIYMAAWQVHAAEALPESYRLEDLTQEDIQAISQGLLELPGKTGLPRLQKIQAQLNKQVEEAKAKGEQQK